MGTNENLITGVTWGGGGGGGGNEMGDQWELYNQGLIGGPMRWGTNEKGVIRVALGANEMRNQWEQGRQG